MADVKDEDIVAIGRVLNDENRPLKERFRALFTLKNIGGKLAIDQIEKGFNDRSLSRFALVLEQLHSVEGDKFFGVCVCVCVWKKSDRNIRH